MTPSTCHDAPHFTTTLMASTMNTEEAGAWGIYVVSELPLDTITFSPDKPAFP